MMSTALHLGNNHISNASLMTTKHANSIITGTGQTTATAVVIQPVVNESQLLVLATTATESLGPPRIDTNATSASIIEPMSPVSSTSTTSVSPTSNQFISVSVDNLTQSYASLTPVQHTNTTSVGGAKDENNGATQAGSFHVQFVEQTDIYANNTNGPNSNQIYRVYSDGTTIYTTNPTTSTNVPQSTQFFNNAGKINTTAFTTATAGNTHFLVHHTPVLPATTTIDDTTTVIARSLPTESMFAANHPSSTTSITLKTETNPPVVNNSNIINHTTRVSPVTVQWLIENYETGEGVSLPRSTLYAHYIYHCLDQKLDPVNAASFGKLIRSVFLGLRTRRLGTRGNSKYHYYGIRLKANSNLHKLQNDKINMYLKQQQQPQQQQSQSQSTNTTTSMTSNNTSKTGNTKCNSVGSSSNSKSYHTSTIEPIALSQYQDYLGDGVGVIPDFPDIDFCSELLPIDCNLDDVDTFKAIYREHCEAFLDAILNLEFNTIETLWREFWRTQDIQLGDECEEEKYLSKSKLLSLCAMEKIQEFVKCVDLRFYQNLVHFLLPDVLKPIPSPLTQAIRNFSKNLESWLSSAMNCCPLEMLSAKLSAVVAFGQSLRRYTSLNHLAQAANAVLHNNSQINQMLSDLNRVDFHSVHEQASWVCQCDSTFVSNIESEFKVALQNRHSLEQWADWLKTVIQTVLQPFEDCDVYSLAARKFLLKWSFYSSMVIRDLTLRSAASFGSFHLIRLLFDEYLFYIIEHEIAFKTDLPPIAVMIENGLTNCNYVDDELLSNELRMMAANTNNSTSKRMRTS